MSRSKPPVLKLDPAVQQAACEALKRLLDDRFEVRLGSFEVQEIIDFFAQELGPHYYNHAIADAQTLLSDRFTGIESDLCALEKS